MKRYESVYKNKKLLKEFNTEKLQEIIVEILESRIEGQARKKPYSIAAIFDNPRAISSLVRSNIKIFASTAIPIERINPATPANVIVIGINLNMASVRSKYTTSANDA